MAVHNTDLLGKERISNHQTMPNYLLQTADKVYLKITVIKYGRLKCFGAAGKCYVRQYAL